MHMATTTDLVGFVMVFTCSLQQFATVGVVGLALSWRLQALDLEADPSAEAVGLNKVLLGWVAMNDDISQIRMVRILMCYHQSSTHRSSWTNRNGKIGNPLKCIHLHAIKWNSEILSANNLQVLPSCCRWNLNWRPAPQKLLWPRPGLWVWTRLVPASCFKRGGFKDMWQVKQCAFEVLLQHMS